MSIYPYVYRLDNPITGEFYIGVRTGNKVPAEQDLGKIYFTSSKYVKPRFKEFTSTILAIFFDPDDAFLFEQSTILENYNSTKILNKFCFKNSKKIFINKSCSVEHRQKISESRLKNKKCAESSRKNRIMYGEKNPMHKSNRNYSSQEEIIRREKQSLTFRARTKQDNLNAYSRIKTEEEKLKISQNTKRTLFCIHCRKEMIIANIDRHNQSREKNGHCNR